LGRLVSPAIVQHFEGQNIQSNTDTEQSLCPAGRAERAKRKGDVVVYMIVVDRCRECGDKEDRTVLRALGGLCQVCYGEELSEEYRRHGKEICWGENGFCVIDRVRLQ